MMIIDEARIAFFATRLAYQTDVSDVHAAVNRMAEPEEAFVLVDSRGSAAWARGRIPGAVHLPTAEIDARALIELDLAIPVVTYCWGPGCNGATRAALALARLGFTVTEMIGGIEYWVREGFEVCTDAGVLTRPVDPLTAPGWSAPCEC